MSEFYNSCQTCAYFNFQGRGSCGMGLDYVKRRTYLPSDKAPFPCYSWTHLSQRPKFTEPEHCCFWDLRSNYRIEQCPKRLRQVVGKEPLFKICHYEMKKKSRRSKVFIRYTLVISIAIKSDDSELTYEMTKDIRAAMSKITGADVEVSVERSILPNGLIDWSGKRYIIFKSFNAHYKRVLRYERYRHKTECRPYREKVS